MKQTKFIKILWCQPPNNKMDSKADTCYLTQTLAKNVSIALWETEDDMKASEKSGYLQEQIAKFAAVLAAPPTTEHFEVAVQM